MFVLTRKMNEVIVIDEVISLRVLKIQGGKVRLGIVAPDNIPVHRQEVLGEKAVSPHKPAFPVEQMSGVGAES